MWLAWKQFVVDCNGYEIMWKGNIFVGAKVLCSQDYCWVRVYCSVRGWSKRRKRAIAAEVISILRTATTVSFSASYDRISPYGKLFPFQRANTTFQWKPHNCWWKEHTDKPSVGKTFWYSFANLIVLVTTTVKWAAMGALFSSLSRDFICWVFLVIRETYLLKTIRTPFWDWLLLPHKKN